MQEQKIGVDGSRRRLFKLLAGGGVAGVAAVSLPDRRVKPVVDRIVPPAHAQTDSVKEA